jgi:hypothetical protein
MKRTFIITLLTILVFHTYIYASVNTNSPISDEIMFDALNRMGCSLLHIQVLSEWTSNRIPNNPVHVCKVKVLNVFIAGDLTTNDTQSPIDLFVGVAHKNPLDIGGQYVLFVDRRAPYYYSWAFSNVKVDSTDTILLNRIDSQAQQIYPKTKMYKIRKGEVKDPNPFITIPNELKELCANFKANQGNRCDLGNQIMRSDIGTPRDESKPWLSYVIYLPPKIRISRLQLIDLIGEPTLKSGRVYSWYCGKQPNGRAGVLIARFSMEDKINTLNYGGENFDDWIKE